MKMSHDTNFVQTFLWKFWTEYIRRTPFDQTQFKSIYIESDGAAAHFKQRYSLEALTQFQNDFGLRRCGWTFACAGHGKSNCDGLGASIKHRLRRYLIDHDSNLLKTQRHVRAVGDSLDTTAIGRIQRACRAHTSVFGRQ